MNPKIVSQLVTLGTGPLTYSHFDEKERFHSKGRTVLKYVAEDLGLPKGSFDIRSNKGGMAVSGEITLHSDNLYIQVSSSICWGCGILYRTCKGRKDYSGGRNNWMKIEALLDFPTALATFAALLPARESQLPRAA